MRMYALTSMSGVNSLHALCFNRYASCLIIHGRRQAMIAVTYLLFLVSSPFHQGYQIYLFAVEVTGIQYSYFVIVQPVRIVRLTLILKLFTRRLQQRLRCPALAQVKVVRGAGYYYINLDTSKSVYKTIICAQYGWFQKKRRKRIQIPLKMGHHRPASETPFKWRFAGGPMMAQH